jgi:hypothetical protein
MPRYRLRDSQDIPADFCVGGPTRRGSRVAATPGPSRAASASGIRYPSNAVTDNGHSTARSNLMAARYRTGPVRSSRATKLRMTSARSVDSRPPSWTESSQRASGRKRNVPSRSAPELERFTSTTSPPGRSRARGGRMPFRKATRRVARRSASIDGPLAVRRAAVHQPRAPGGAEHHDRVGLAAAPNVERAGGRLAAGAI